MIGCRMPTNDKLDLLEKYPKSQTFRIIFTTFLSSKHFYESVCETKVKSRISTGHTFRRHFVYPTPHNMTPGTNTSVQFTVGIYKSVQLAFQVGVVYIVRIHNA